MGVERMRSFYEKVRPIVEERCGRGSLSEKKFLTLWRQGQFLVTKARRRQRATDTLSKRLDQLERRVIRLERK